MNKDEKDDVCQLLSFPFKNFRSYDLREAFKTLGIEVNFKDKVTETQPDTGGDGNANRSSSGKKAVLVPSTFKLIPSKNSKP